MERGYTVIPDWMLEIEGIDVYELLILAVIYGHSQDDGSAFRGSLTYLAGKAKCTRRKVLFALQHLVALELIAKVDKEVNGVHRCEYSYTGGGEHYSPVNDIHHPRCTTFTTPGERHSPPAASPCARVHNVKDIIINKQDNSDINMSINTGIKEKKEKTTQKESKEKNGAKFDFRGALLEAGVSAAHVAEWMEIRKVKQAVNSRTAFALLVGEARRAGLTVDAAVTLCIEESWKGFRACYMRGRFPDYGRQAQGGSLAEGNAREMEKALDMIMNTDF